MRFFRHLRMTLCIAEFLDLRFTLPVVDVRSEGEFESGHIRGAVNIPILNNAERKAVGTDYKQKGRNAAIKTGFQLVGPRLTGIIEEAEKVAMGGEMLVHCWRGGMRSGNFCQFVGMAGVKASSLDGGYKTYRHRALQAFEVPYQLIILGGLTGSGKSEILRSLRDLGEQVVDLESLANHKGSAFGALMMPPQPSTEQFQNELFEDLHALDPARRIWVEDESIAVGKIFLPEPFWRRMTTSPVIEMEVPKDVRISRLVAEYGPADPEEFLTCMNKIEKKMGGQNLKAARERLHSNDMPATIDLLLTYYDKAYGTGLKNKKHRIAGTLAWDGRDAHAFAAELAAWRPAL
jgi:tRNA 2-selenouridine synthase